MRHLLRLLKLVLIAFAGAALLGFLLLAWQDWLTGLLLTFLFLGLSIRWLLTRPLRPRPLRPRPPPRPVAWKPVSAPPPRRHDRNADWVTPFVIGWIVGDWLFDDDHDDGA